MALGTRPDAGAGRRAEAGRPHSAAGRPRAFPRRAALRALPARPPAGARRSAAAFEHAVQVHDLERVLHLASEATLQGLVPSLTAALANIYYLSCTSRRRWPSWSGATCSASRGVPLGAQHAILLTGARWSCTSSSRSPSADVPAVGLLDTMAPRPTRTPARAVTWPTSSLRCRACTSAGPPYRLCHVRTGPRGWVGGHLPPPVTALVVVITANHYWFDALVALFLLADAVAGAAAAAVRPAAARWTQRRTARLCYDLPMGTDMKPNGPRCGRRGRPSSSSRRAVPRPRPRGHLHRPRGSPAHRRHRRRRRRAARALSQLQPPVDDVLAQLENAEEWGPLRLRPARAADPGASPTYSYIQNRTPTEGRRPLAPAPPPDEAAGGRALACLAVSSRSTCPATASAPDAEQRRVRKLDQGGRQALGWVVDISVLLLLDRAARLSSSACAASGDLRRPAASSSTWRCDQLDTGSPRSAGNLGLPLDDLPPGDPAERALHAIERATGRIQDMVQRPAGAGPRSTTPTGPCKEVPVDLGRPGQRHPRPGVALEAAASHLTTSVCPRRPVPRSSSPATPGSLDDLVSNLVSNALKDLPLGSAPVGVKAEVVEDGAPPYVALPARRAQGHRHRPGGPGPAVRGVLPVRGPRRPQPGPGQGLGLPVVDRVVRRQARGGIEAEVPAGRGHHVPGAVACHCPET